MTIAGAWTVASDSDHSTGTRCKGFQTEPDAKLSSAALAEFHGRQAKARHDPGAGERMSPRGAPSLAPVSWRPPRTAVFAWDEGRISVAAESRAIPRVISADRPAWVTASSLKLARSAR